MVFGTNYCLVACNPRVPGPNMVSYPLKNEHTHTQTHTHTHTHTDRQTHKMMLHIHLLLCVANVQYVCTAMASYVGIALHGSPLCFFLTDQRACVELYAWRRREAGNEANISVQRYCTCTFVFCPPPPPPLFSK